MARREVRRATAALVRASCVVLAMAAACTVFDGRTLPAGDAGSREAGSRDAGSRDASWGDVSSGDAGSCDGSQTQSDTHNCGACGHDCLGGSCSSAVCQPELLVPPSDAGVPLDLAVDDTYVFWATDDGSIHRIGKDGSGPTLLRAVVGGAGPARIAVDRANLYYSNVALMSVLQLSKDGTQVVTFVDDLMPGRLASNGAALLWTHVSGTTYGGIMRASLPMDGGATEIWSHRQLRDELTVDENAVYWGEFASVEQGANDGTGTLTELARCSTANGLAVSDASVFVASEGGVTSLPKNQSDMGSCASPAAQMIAEDTPAFGIAVGGPGLVVFTDPGAGLVYAAPQSGTCSGTCIRTLATGQVSPGRVAADAQAAYWVNGDGSLGKVAF
jgi:hypothetical protein